jgi:hypothetical protein
MRLCIALFLLTIFSFQALPVRDLSKIWAKASLTNNCDEDELGDSHGGIKIKKSKATPHDYIPGDAQCTAIVAVKTAEQLLLHRADHLPVMYAGEVLTPPPNC